MGKFLFFQLKDVSLEGNESDCRKRGRGLVSVGAEKEKARVAAKERVVLLGRYGNGYREEGGSLGGFD